jgi:protein-L-isoaspartate O-methyltransferase
MTLVHVPEDLLCRVVAHLPPEVVNETAVPSYTHANPLIRWLFRKRLETALALARIQGTERVLDFGTGSGILLASLARMVGHVAATDLDVTPARQLVAALGLPVEVVGPDDFPAWAEQNAGQLDIIMALDVFEHFTPEELERVNARLRALLATGGRLVVSGPTESAAYKIGRRIAGFRNTYHYRSVFDIDAQLREHWQPQATRFIPLAPRAFLLTSYLLRS